MNAPAAETKKTAIRPNLAGMVKTKNGSYHKDDFVGVTLAGLTVAQVSLIAEKHGVDVTKYSHLNPGQVRMTLGNRLRAMTKIAEVPEVDGKPDQKVCDKNEEAFAVRQAIEDDAAEMTEANAKAKEEAIAAKVAAKVAKAAAVESEGGEA